MRTMSPGSMASYRAALPPECLGEPDEDAPTGPVGPPVAVVVSWLEPFTWTEQFEDGTTWTHQDRARSFRVFGSEPWRWKHAVAWKEAMERRYGKGNAWIEEEF